MSAIESSEYRNLAANVRVAFGRWHVGNSTMLRDVLEISTHRARNLYAGRTSYTAGDLWLLSSFFGVPPEGWFAAREPMADYRDSARETDVIARAWDRLMTARESQRHTV